MQDTFQEGVDAANFRIALEHLRIARNALSKTSRADLGSKIKKMGKEIVSHAFKNLPESLAKQLADYHKQN